MRNHDLNPSFLLGWPIFRREHVSFRECIFFDIFSLHRNDFLLEIPACSSGLAMSWPKMVPRIRNIWWLWLQQKGCTINIGRQKKGHSNMIWYHPKVMSWLPGWCKNGCNPTRNFVRIVGRQTNTWGKEIRTRLTWSMNQSGHPDWFMEILMSIKNWMGLNPNGPLYSKLRSSQ